MAFRKKKAFAPTYDGGQGLCIGHRINGTPAYLNDKKLCQHTLVVGKSAFGSDSLVMRILAQHIARGGGFIVIDSMLDRDMADQIACLMSLHGKADDFRLMNVDDPQSSHTYNPVGHGSVESVTARLLYPFLESWEADFPNLRDELYQAVKQAVETLQAYPIPRTFSRVLAPLMASTEGASHQALYRLMSFATGKFGQVLDEPEPEITPADVLRFKQGLYVTLPTMGKDIWALTLGKMVLADLCSALEEHAREHTEAPDRSGPPFLIVVHDTSLFLTAESVGLFDKARAADAAVMAFESSVYSEPYWSADTRELLLSQTASKLFLGAFAKHDCSTQVEMLAQDPPPIALKWHGIARRRPITKAELKEMPLGKSVLKTDAEVERLEYPAMPQLGDVPTFRRKAPVAVQSIPTARPSAPEATPLSYGLSDFAPLSFSASRVGDELTPDDLRLHCKERFAEISRSLRDH